MSVIGLFVLLIVIISVSSPGQQGASTPSATPAAAPLAQTGTGGGDPQVAAGDYGNDTGEALVKDKEFVLVLGANGIKFSSNTKAVITGRAICILADQPGATFLEIGMQVEKQGGYSYPDATGQIGAAGFVTGAAIAAYCPQHNDLVPGGNG